MNWRLLLFMTGFNVHGARTNQVSQSEMLLLKLDFKLLIIFCFASCVTFIFFNAFPQQMKGVIDRSAEHLKKYYFLGFSPTKNRSGAFKKFRLLPLSTL